MRVSGIDPKGMELAYGRRIFHRYAVTSRDALALLDDLVEGMEARKAEHTGHVRTVPISRGSIRWNCWSSRDRRPDPLRRRPQNPRSHH